jgi:hypothetical protein
MRENITSKRRGELIELEQAFWNAMKQRDGQVARDLTDDTVIVVNSQGIGEVEQAAIGGMVEKASWDLEQFSFGDNVHVKMIGDDVAIVAYAVDEQVVVDGKRTAVNAFDTSVWVRKLGKWVCALHTESLAGDPFGRDRTNGKPRAVG